MSEWTGGIEMHACVRAEVTWKDRSNAAEWCCMEGVGARNWRKRMLVNKFPVRFGL